MFLPFVGNNWACKMPHPASDTECTKLLVQKVNRLCNAGRANCCCRNGLMQDGGSTRRQMGLHCGFIVLQILRCISYQAFSSVQ